MVRLLPYEVRQVIISRPEFQSHNGAIAAGRWFQITLPADEVSIPQWCDCCDYVNFYLVIGEPVSIPQWCDCCGYGVMWLLRYVAMFQSHNGAIAAGRIGLGD